MTMRQQWWTTAAVAGIVLALGTAPALAADKTSKTPTMSESSTVTAPTDMKEASRHTMEGELTKVDAKKGKVHLKTREAGTLELHFPSAALANLKKGDRVTVEMTIDSVMPAASPSTGLGKIKNKLTGK
jgi:hypothetical protein